MYRGTDIVCFGCCGFFNFFFQVLAGFFASIQNFTLFGGCFLLLLYRFLYRYFLQFWLGDSQFCKKVVSKRFVKLQHVDKSKFQNVIEMKRLILRFFIVETGFAWVGGSNGFNFFLLNELVNVY